MLSAHVVSKGQCLFMKTQYRVLIQNLLKQRNHWETKSTDSSVHGKSQ